ncbi:MAG TPA: hypothetical protein VHF25_16045, partial [Nitriliruptorales bacterium]|nr:hypothetical protein [Nitriliruptorales bacterium]
MRIRACHRGADRPFERDRRLELRCLPAGATIASAVATVTPVDRGGDGRFLETIRFDDPDKGWGATKRRNGAWVEVDLHARRRLAHVRGVDLESGALLVDLGGGFTAVDQHGGLGGDAPFQLQSDAQDLPGLVVAGLRITGTNGNGGSPDITQLRVASPPTNLTMAVEGQPAFWVHVGDLVDPATTPDFSVLLKDALGCAELDHDHHVIGLVMHSDSIARLDVTLDIEFSVTASATPAGVDRVSLPFAFGSVPEASRDTLAITVPTGAVAAPGGTAGRVQGAFEPSR